MAQTFDSTTDRITTGTAAAIPVTGSFSMWLQPTWAQTDGVQHCFYCCQVDANNAFHLLKIADNRLFAGWFTATVDYRVVVASASYTLNQNAWNHLALTWDDTANVSKCFLNGSQIGSSTSTLVTHATTAVKTIGNLTSGIGNNDVRGDVAEVAIWNIVLGADEITALSKAVAPSMIHPNSIVDYHDCLRDATAWRGTTPTFTTVATAPHCRIIRPAGNNQAYWAKFTATLALDGTLTSSGTLVKSVSKNVAGTLTSSGSLVRLALKNPKGTLASSGALVKSVSKNVAGTLTTAGALVKSASKNVAGTLTSSGTLVRSVSKQCAGTLTTAGSLVKSVSKNVSGTLSLAGIVSKTASKLLTGLLDFIGSLTSSTPAHPSIINGMTVMGREPGIRADHFVVVQPTGRIGEITPAGRDGAVQTTERNTSIRLTG